MEVNFVDPLHPQMGVDYESVAVVVVCSGHLEGGSSPVPPFQGIPSELPSVALQHHSQHNNEISVCKKPKG
jgi:hypothetical protein